MGHKFLVHNKGDSVGVAVEDIAGAEVVAGFYMDDDTPLELTARGPIPLGHKIALTDVAAGDRVIEYRIPIGIAPEGFAKGDYVHTHNLRSARW